MKVKNAMHKEVYTLSPDDSFASIIKTLKTKKISGAPVVDKKGKLVGFVSEKDLFHNLFPSQEEFYADPEYYMDFDNVEKNAKTIHKLKAKDIMSKNVITLAPEDHILKACSYLLMKKIRRIPVLDKGKLVGIVTTSDIYHRYLNNFVKLTKKHR